MDKHPPSRNVSKHRTPSFAGRSRRGYLWVTSAFFLLSLIGHWTFGWFAYEHESEAHHQEPIVSDYVIEVGRDTLENWQSEFLQLIWQVAGLAVLLHVGSPSSKEGDERIEAKLDYLLSRSKEGEEALRELDVLYLRE